MSLCLNTCLIYPTCKMHMPHYVAICDLTGCTTLSHKLYDLRKNYKHRLGFDFFYKLV